MSVRVSVCLPGHDKITFERQLIEMNSSRLRLVASSIKIRTYVREYLATTFCPTSLSHSLSLVALRIFLLRLRPTMRLSVSMLSPTNNEKNLRICFEARKIIKNNPFPFFSLPLFPLFCFEVRAQLSSGCHCRLSGHRLAELVDCFCSRFKQLRCVYAMYACVGQFVCLCVLQLFHWGNLYAS